MVMCFTRGNCSHNDGTQCNHNDPIHWHMSNTWDSRNTAQIWLWKGHYNVPPKTCKTSWTGWSPCFLVNIELVSLYQLVTLRFHMPQNNIWMHACGLLKYPVVNLVEKNAVQTVFEIHLPPNDRALSLLNVMHYIQQCSRCPLERHHTILDSLVLHLMIPFKNGYIIGRIHNCDG